MASAKKRIIQDKSETQFFQSDGSCGAETLEQLTFLKIMHYDN